jgi:hypothetical protein
MLGRSNKFIKAWKGEKDRRMAGKADTLRLWCGWIYNSAKHGGRLGGLANGGGNCQWECWLQLNTECVWRECDQGWWRKIYCTLQPNFRRAVCTFQGSVSASTSASLCINVWTLLKLKSLESGAWSVESVLESTTPLQYAGPNGPPPPKIISQN